MSVTIEEARVRISNLIEITAECDSIEDLRFNSLIQLSILGEATEEIQRLRDLCQANGISHKRG